MTESKKQTESEKVAAANAQNNGEPEDSRGRVVSENDTNSEGVEEKVPFDPAEGWRDMKRGHMGEQRIRLMQALGLDVNTEYDKKVERKIKELVPEYDGVLTLEMMQQIEGRELVTSKE